MAWLLKKPFRLAFGAILALLCLIIGWEFRAEHEVEDWLNGGSTVGLQSIEIFGQGREATVKDKQVLKYFNEAAKKAKRISVVSEGLSYRGRVKIGPYQTREIVIGVPTDGKEMEFGVPEGLIGTEYKYWSIAISPDAPMEITDLMGFLRSEKSRGQSYRK